MGTSQEKCGEVQALLFDRALGQLEPGALAGVEEHLGGCAECRALAAEIAGTVAELDGAPTIAPSPGFDTSLAARIGVERERGWSARLDVSAVLGDWVLRLRQFQLGAAVYPLVALVFVYIGWTVVSHRGAEPPSYAYDTPHGLVLLRAPRDLRLRPAKPKEKAQAAEPDALVELAELERAAAEALAERSEGDLFTPGAPEPPFMAVPPLPLPRDPATQPVAARKEPATTRELIELPVPHPVPLVLPRGGPQGEALARARYGTIKNAERYVRLAISSGLVWLCRNQERDGRWTASAGRKRSGEYSDVEVTAAAALALMECGFTGSGRKAPERRLRAALKWLVKEVDGARGELVAPPGGRRLHAQAMVCATLSEAVRLSDSRAARAKYQDRVETTLGALMRAQAKSGAWAGGAEEDAELTAMALLAAGAARAAGLGVDPGPHGRALAWLDSYRRALSSGTYASQGLEAGELKSVSYATAGGLIGSPEAVLSEAAALAAAKRELAADPITWRSGEFFRWYVGTLGAYRLDGEFWRTWRSQLHLALILHQSGGPRVRGSRAERGSWEPHGQDAAGGRAYATAMGVLTLTASLGHSPVYGSSK